MDGENWAGFLDKKAMKGVKFIDGI